MKTIAFINNTENKKTYRFVECGEANGYVAVPPEHPLFGKDYDDIYGIDVHGGLTAAGQLKKYNMQDVEFLSDTKEIPIGWWVFGFDTMHFGDNKVNWTKERVKEETLRLQEQLENVEQ